MGIQRISQTTSIVSRDIINGSWKQIRGIEGCFVWYVTIIYRYGREIQIWTNTINLKVFVEVVINHPIIVTSR